jgi:hypothetical protein
MERAAASVSAPATLGFRDGLGERRQNADPTGTESLEQLCLRSELATVPAFEFALRERVSRLGPFRHPSFGRVRSVERLPDAGATLAVVSERTPGIRLSELLQQSQARHVPIDINSSLCLIRQLVPAVAMLHETARDVAHGALAPERLIVTPNGRLVVVEYVMGAALEQLRYSHERYWQELRIAVPRSVGLPRLDHRTDVTQIGIVALSLVLGRELREDEFPSRIGEVVAATWAVSARGGFEPLPPGLRSWLGRTLQLDPRNAFASAVEARAELERVLGDSELMASPASLEAYFARFNSTGSAEAASAHVAPPRPGLPPAPSFAPKPAPEIVVPPAGGAAAGPSVRRPASELPAPALARPQLPPAAPAEAAEVREKAASPGTNAPPDKAGEPAKAAPPPIEFAFAREAESGTRESATPITFDLNAGHSAQGRWPRLLAAVAVLALLAGSGYGVWSYFTAAPQVAMGTLVITSNPSGATAMVNGEPRGMTPVTLSLAPGQHTIELRGSDGETKSVPVMVTAGMQSSHYIELPKRDVVFGQLQVRTEPPGAKVTVDGVQAGVSPMMVIELAPGPHEVILEGELGSVRQTVMVEAGMTASLVVPMATTGGAPLSGWVTVSAPIEVQLFEGGRLLGSSQSDRILMTTGRHEIDVVNEALGYRATRVVQVAPGKVTPLAVEVPRGVMSLNALPWADVWIDGERVGQTPIGNVETTIGRHEVVFRHPELGEQVHTAIVTLKGVTRLSVDMRKR